MELSDDPTLVGDMTLAGEPTRRQREDEPRRVAQVLEAGAELGRYSVLSVLGAGAMGVVYAAYDPQLDRRVAIKVIQAAEPSEAAHARLLREAQALARLSHPNVVAVHDVGIHEGRVFVAMEFIAGRTLAQLDWREREWREIVAIYRAAGRGLGAAHRAGLVHRDFKPANVMLREDGRVVVKDFGLARAHGEGDSGERAPSLLVTLPERLSSSTASTFDAQLTQTGSLLGTPGYMAPELFSGAPATARSDQFGFCVALYEALYGERPFAGDSTAAIYFNMIHNGFGRLARA